MKKLLIAAALAGLTSTTYAIPLINLDVGVAGWQPDYSGDIGSSQADVEDLGLEDDTANIFYATLEFPVPLIPALKVKRTELETTGTGNLDVEFTFDDFIFEPSANVITDLDLTHNDFTIYWGLPKFYLDVDFGVTFRQFDGSASVTGTTSAGIESEEVDLDVVIPLLFSDIRLDLPFTGLYGRVEGNLLSIGDNSLTDLTAAIGYNSNALPLLFDFELEAGYRVMELTLDEDDLDLAADIDISGPYLGVQLAF